MAKQMMEDSKNSAGCPFSIVEAPVHDGMLASSTDIDTIAKMYLAHVQQLPDFIVTAPHTIEGMTEWFSRKSIDNLWFAEDLHTGERLGAVALSRHSYFDINGAEQPQHAVEICRLIVHPSFRNRKIGSALFSTAYESARKDNPWITVLSGSAEEAIYRKWGWVAFGRVPSQDDPLDHIVAMRRP